VKDPKRIVRDGYDKISLAYRSESFDFEPSVYRRFLLEFEAHLAPRSRILDLGCGCGIPVARYLAENHEVTGIDISEAQIVRARQLVPAARFLCADMAQVDFENDQFDAIVSFYAIIHLPVAEQPGLLKKIAHWLASGGHFMAIVGHQAWTGTEANWKGAEMYWSHADVATYKQWLHQLHIELLAEHFVPEGDGGHSLLIARKSAEPKA
jgi:cyclopropane fatty-acyl-phospholipid synthase-like methyltransferase